MPNYHYKPGDWNATCDVCGRRFYASQLQQRWDGVMVCKEDFETRHPQDLLRIRGEQNNLPFTRPVNDQYLNEVTYLDDGTSIPTGTFNPDTL